MFILMENIIKEMQCQKCRKHFKKKNKNHRTLAKKEFGFNKVAGENWNWNKNWPLPHVFDCVTYI